MTCATERPVGDDTREEPVGDDTREEPVGDETLEERQLLGDGGLGVDAAGFGGG